MFEAVSKARASAGTAAALLAVSGSLAVCGSNDGTTAATGSASTPRARPSDVVGTADAAVAAL